MLNSKSLNVLLISLLLILGSTPMKITNHSEKTSTLSKITSKEQQDKLAKADSILKGANIAKECIKAVMETQNPDFCWKKGGDVGKTPYGCPTGWFRHLALCYENCRRDYHFVSGVCWNGAKSYIPSSKTNFSSEATCETGYYKSGALCYKDCANQGMENCGIGACASDSTKCVSQVVSMALDVVTGVGQFALLIASGGATAGANQATNQAVNQAKTMAKTVKQTAFNKVKTSFTKFFDRTVQKAKKAFIDNLKGLPLDKTVEWYAKNVCESVWKGIQISMGNKIEPEEIDLASIAKKYDVLGVSTIFDKCKSKKDNTAEGCAQSAMQFASTFDPTGLLTIAAAFVLPTCNVDPITAHVDAFKVNRTPKFICPKCDNVVTNVQDSGANNGVEYLDRHSISCGPNQLLNFFSFTQDSGKLVSNYRCITPDSAVSNCRNVNSKWDELPRNQGALNFLDRLEVNCGNDFLQSVRLNTNGNKMSYAFTCCNANNSTPNANLFFTNKNGLSSWGTDQFSKIDGVDAGTRNAISYFKPRTEGNQFFYQYKVGLVNSNGETSTYYDDATEWQDAGEGSIWFLDRHTPWCARPNSAMVSFRLERRGERLRYAYKCIQNARISYDKVEIRRTEWSDVGGDEKKAVHFLDRHFVTCPANTTIRGFGVRRQDAPGNLLQIVYGCVATVTGEVINNRTSRTDFSGYQTYYLDRQTYQPLGPDEVLQSFKLETKYNPDHLDYYFSSASLY